MNIILNFLHFSAKQQQQGTKNVLPIQEVKVLFLFISQILKDGISIIDSYSAMLPVY